ncbi:MAG: ATP-grasp domain-containing protein [Candidatus Methanomethylophilaceae archaeon]|nr:ATP-grasp domain-containing protein [Candidatus Methanomethylophilaceae archaeon]
MRCWILYDRTDLESNTFFAERLRDCGNELGMDCSIVTTDTMDIEDAPEIVISRIRDSDLVSQLEDYGSTVFNKSSVCRICNDKSFTYSFVKSLGIPILPFSFPGQQLPPGPPWVVKSCIGHGGSEVFKAENEKEVSEYCDRLDGRKPIVQQFASSPGRDLRVYVLGGRIIASVMRSSDSDFRANFKLGGKAELVEPPAEVVDIVRRIVPELMADFIGIDFVFGDGKVYLNEIEDVVGTRMLYSLTDLDPARMYMEYVAHSKMSL